MKLVVYIFQLLEEAMRPFFRKGVSQLPMQSHQGWGQ